MTALPLDRLSELERLAKAATPGPWVQRRFETVDTLTSASLDSRSLAEFHSYSSTIEPTRPRRTANAAYVAAANPATILDLIQALRLSEAEREEDRAELRAARDALRQVAASRRAVGPIATMAQSAAWRASEHLKDNPHD